VNPSELMGRSRAVLGFWLVHAATRPGMLAEAMDGMFAMVRAGTLRPVVGGAFPLAEARRAHEELLSRRSTGKLVLTV
jgi:NADPH2:quinone reductase